MKIWVCSIFGIIFLVGGPLLGNFLISKGNEYRRQATIKSRLDQKVLVFLQKLNGLMFAEQQIDIDTVRYLIQQDIIRTEVFPSKPISYGYCLTDFGKRVLKDLGIDLFPDIIIDMHRVRYWVGYQKKGDFQQKKANFKKDRKRDFDECIGTFFKYIPRGFIDLAAKGLGKNINSYDDRLDIFSRFLEDAAISYEDKMKVIKRWEQNRS